MNVVAGSGRARFTGMTPNIASSMPLRGAERLPLGNPGPSEHRTVGRRRVSSAVSAVLALGVLVTTACSPAATPSPTPEATDPGYVTRAGYGDDWPFSVPAGTLACYDGAAAGGGGRVLVTFSTGNGIEYGLNGSALDFGFPDLDATILPAYPDKSQLSPLIEVGLALC